MHFTRDIILLCSFLSIATAAPAKNPAKKAFRIIDTTTGELGVTSFGPGSAVIFLQQSNSTTFYLAPYQDESSALHIYGASTDAVAVVLSGINNQPLFYPVAQVPSDSTIVSCTRTKKTKELDCSAKGLKYNVLDGNNQWRLLDQPVSYSFTMGTLPALSD